MIDLTHFSATCARGAASAKVIRAALAAAFLAVPVALHGQERGVRDQPRSFEVFGGVSGYEAFSPDRFGTPASPRPDELGFTLVLRMFRNVCLGIERGSAIEAVMPLGFAAYHSSPYYFGPGTAQRGETTILSSTGDIEEDENGGNPALSLEPDASGMTCSVEWRIPEEMSPQSRRAIAGLIENWLPWELALVPASRPLGMDQPALSNAIEWDRPCQERWCPATAFYSLSRGDVTMQMTLNITGIQGDRP